MLNKDILQVPNHSLGISLSLNTNSSLTNISDATIIYWALRDYKLGMIKSLIKCHAESVESGNFEDASKMWAEIAHVEALQGEIADSAVELAENNYWAAEQLRNPSDYAQTKLHHAETKVKALADYLEEFKISA